MAKRPSDRSADYQRKRRQILAKFHRISLPQPDSKRNRQIISRYHGALFGRTKRVEGKRRHIPGLLTGPHAIKKLSHQATGKIKAALTFHGRPINYRLPLLGNRLITQQGDITVRGRYIYIRRRHITQVIPVIDRKRFIVDRQAAFEEAARQQPAGTRITIRIGSHLLPGTYADLEAARREFLRLIEEYREQEVDIAIEFLKFEDQDEEAEG